MISRQIYITMKDQSVWAVPLEIIKKQVMEDYGEESKSMSEAQLEEWAKDNMNWDDVRKFARKVSNPPMLTQDDFQDAWANSNWEVK